MSTTFARRHRRVALALLAPLGILLLLPWLLPSAAADSSAQQAVAQAWDLARASGSYRYHAALDQTTYPGPSLHNVGRASRQDHLIIDGTLDQPRQKMEFSLQPKDNPNAAVAMRV